MSVSYRPSSGTEGAWFTNHWCCNCKADTAFWAGTGDSCPIAAATMAFEKSEPGYPPEWVSEPDGSYPRCTAFEIDGADVGRIEHPNQIEMPLTRGADHE